MIKAIFLKEMRVYFHSLRLSLALVISLIAFIMAGINFSQTMMDRGRYFSDGPGQRPMAARYEEAKRSLAWVYNTGLPYFPGPQATLLINSGSEKDLPSVYWTQATNHFGEEYHIQQNLMIPNFLDLDWNFVVGIIFSFLALIFLYDSVSGEKEGRTLGIALSSSVSRLELFWGKYLAGMAVCSAVLVIGLAASTLTVIITGSAELTFDWLIRATVSLVAFLVYLSVFVLLGLVGSALFSRSSLSLVFLLFMWTLLVWTLPNLGGVFGEYFKPLQPIRQFNREMTEPLEKFAEEIDYFVVMQKRDYAVDRGFVEIEAGLKDKQERYWYDFLDQVMIGRKSTMLSPLSVLEVLTETVSATGVYHLRSFFSQIFYYRGVFKNSVEQIDSRDPDSPHFISNYLKRWGGISRQPFEPAELPVFEERPIPVEQSLADSLPYWLLLAIFNLAFGLGGYLLLYRYDARA